MHLSVILFGLLAWQPLFVLALPHYVHYGVGGTVFFACEGALNVQVTLCNSTDPYLCFCSSDVGIASMAGCFSYNNLNKTRNYKYWRNYCKSTYKVSLSNEQIAEGYTFYEESAKTADQIEGFNATIPIDVPFKLDDATIKLYEAAYKVFDRNYDNSLYYGAGCIGYWGLMIVLSMIYNWTFYLFPKLVDIFDGRFSRMWRKYILLPALVRRKRAEAQRFGYILDFLAPSRLETLVVFFFFWLCFIVNATQIYYVKHDPLMGLRKEALNRYVADRTGIVCTVITPLLVLFGGRNNFVQLLTRWKFSTVLVFHRWIARLVVLMAFIHSVCYTILLIDEGDYAVSMAENYLVWGVVSTTCGALMCFQGLLFLRRRWYETFLVLHILLGIFFLVGLYYHVWKLNYVQIVYPCFAIWGFDRFMRLVRLSLFGLPLATVSLVADETITVRVKRPTYWKVVPGGHVWVYFPSKVWFWQSHPFTMVDKRDGTIMLYCKVKGGITKTLAKKLAAHPEKSIQMRIGIEGPYGEPKPLKGYSNVVFIAGGNGIPGIFSEAMRCAKIGSASKQVLKLVWIIREPRSLVWFWEDLQSLKDTKIETTIYVTRPDSIGGSEELHSLVSAGTDSFEKEEKADASEKFTDNGVPMTIVDQVRPKLPHVQFIEGRPSIESIVLSEIGESATSAAFVACGNPSMVDDVRFHVVKNIDTSQKKVNFFDALEVWA